MQHKLLTAGVCLMGVGLAGCGAGRATSTAGAVTAGAAAGSFGGAASSGPPDASLTGIRACKLVPAATVSAVIGKLSDPPYQTPDGMACFYEPAVPGGVGPTVIVTVLKRSGYEASKAFVRGVEESNPKAANYAGIRGLGDDAFSTAGAKGAQDYEVYAALGGRAVNVSIASTTPAAEQEVRTLTRAALAAL